jgi:hypothetical protein
MGCQLNGQLGGDYADRFFTGPLATFEAANAVGHDKQMASRRARVIRQRW